MKKQKGFIQISIFLVIIMGILVVGSAGYIGVRQYQNYQLEKIKAEKVIQEKEKQVEEERKNQNSEVSKLKEEVEALKSKKPEIITNTIIKEIPAQKTEDDLPSIIKHWRSVIVYIECSFLYQSTTGGSGVARYLSSSDQYIIWTNKHVVGGEAFVDPQSCKVIFPDSILILSSIRVRVGSNSGKDVAIIDIPKPDEYLSNIFAMPRNFCSQKPLVGDKIVILGYPGIGSQADITATEGIISGYDGDYFITSAKVEHGNSGGAAILIKDNCYLGIPSFVKVGSVESLARIFDWHKFVN